MPSVLKLLNVDIQHLFLLFLSYAFIGWMCEEVYCSIGQRKIVKRGMLFGPICPIYGFGGLLILYIVFPWKDTWLRLFLASFVVTTALEYFTSWLLEKLFHAKWWDYKEHFLNINGRVCLLNSTLFGLLGVALWHYVEPVVYKVLYWQPLQKWIDHIYLILTLVLAADILMTIRKLIDFNSTMEKLRFFEEQLKEKYEGEEWFKPQTLHTMFASVREKAKLDTTKFSKGFLERFESLSKRQFSMESFLKRFPSMTSKDYAHSLEHIKAVVKENVEEQKRILELDKAKLKARKEALALEKEKIKQSVKEARKQRKNK